MKPERTRKSPEAWATHALRNIKCKDRAQHYEAERAVARAIREAIEEALAEERRAKRILAAPSSAEPFTEF